MQRKALNMSQVAFAEHVDLSIEMIGKMERGTASPSFPTVERISEKLGVPPTVFFTLGTHNVPTGDYARLLTRLQTSLARMNEDQLAQAERVLAALVE